MLVYSNNARLIVFFKVKLKKISFADFLQISPLDFFVTHHFGDRRYDVYKKISQTTFYGYFKKSIIFSGDP